MTPLTKEFKTNVIEKCVITKISIVSANGILY